MNKKLHPETLAATGLGWIDPETDAMAAPLRPSTSFLRDPTDLDRTGRMFTRDDNPTFAQPEALINALEGGAGLPAVRVRHGSDHVCFSTTRSRRSCDSAETRLLRPARLDEHPRAALGA